jgi:hypothetical protein
VAGRQHQIATCTLPGPGRLATPLEWCL